MEQSFPGTLFSHRRPVNHLPSDLQHPDLPRRHHRPQKDFEAFPRNTQSLGKIAPRYPRRRRPGDLKRQVRSVGDLLEALFEPCAEGRGGMQVCIITDHDRVQVWYLSLSPKSGGGWMTGTSPVVVLAWKTLAAMSETRN